MARRPNTTDDTLHAAMHLLAEVDPASLGDACRLLRELPMRGVETFGEDEWTVLKTMKSAHPMRLTIASIARRSVRHGVELSESAVQRITRRLGENCKIERPEGRKSGLALSRSALRLL